MLRIVISVYLPVPNLEHTEPLEQCDDHKSCKMKRVKASKPCHDEARQAAAAPEVDMRENKSRNHPEQLDSIAPMFIDWQKHTRKRKLVRFWDIGSVLPIDKIEVVVVKNHHA